MPSDADQRHAREDDDDALHSRTADAVPRLSCSANTGRLPPKPGISESPPLLTKVCAKPEDQNRGDGGEPHPQIGVDQHAHRATCDPGQLQQRLGTPEGRRARLLGQVVLQRGVE